MTLASLPRNHTPATQLNVYRRERDSVPVQPGHHDMDLPVPTSSVQRIEILRGAGSAIYGSDALGGVVNVVTLPPLQSEIRVAAGIGDFGINQQSATANIAGTWWSEQLSGPPSQSQRAPCCSCAMEALNGMRSPKSSELPRPLLERSSRAKLRKQNQKRSLEGLVERLR
jgi:hypothetical protein